VANIKLDFGDIGWNGVDWIDMAQDRDQWRVLVEYGIEPSGSMKCWELPEWLTN
jgi:hypothetical protein